jgi:phage tail sheath protein FI
LGETFTNQFAQLEARGDVSGSGDVAVVAATATIIGAASLNGTAGTSLKLVNTDGSIITFTTNATKNFADTVTETESPFTINTKDIAAGSEVRKATQAAWISCKRAIDQGVLNMSISPTTFAGTEEEFTLTQTTAGSAGNTAITLITGITADGETAFTDGAGALDATYLGVILPLVSGSGVSPIAHGARQLPFEDGSTRYNPATGWVFAQDVGGEASKASYLYGNMVKLFRFHGLDHGEWVQNNLKISITNIKYSKDKFNKYGTFDVLVRRSSDTDQVPLVLERFSNCNLDQNSLDFVARKIGDHYAQFDSTKRRLETRGDYANNSKYIRVEMYSDNPVNEELLPFGVYGPLKYKDILITPTNNSAETTFTNGAFALGARQILDSSTIADSAAQLIITGSGLGAAGVSPEFKLMFPKHELRISASQDGISDPTDAYWGVWTGKSSSNNKFNKDYHDLNRNKSDGVSAQYTSTSPVTEYQFIFSLDEVVSGSGNAVYYWASGSRASGIALSSKTSGNTYKTVLDAGLNKFTMPLAGGSDGLDITESDPFRNTLLDGKTQTTNYAYNSIKEAIDIVRDTEFVQYNLVSVPGITNEQLTTHLIETCETRADALAVIDLKGDFAPAHEGTSKTYPDLDTTITNLKNRSLNSSYGCAFYPFVQIRDTIAGNLVYMPSSVAALGAMSYTDRVRAPWFAPAGFNRGGLSSGVAGLPVINVTQKLTSKDRDDLYDANINPIASFPSEGIVIFGQKTLQVTRSALDRINVRRLLLFIKKGISNIAANILFEPNVRSTWARFIGQAEPFLADVKARFGLDDYKLVLDETTTTPDLIDRNVLYAKVYLKPTRAIEFVAVDFIISNTGASFED